MPQVNCKICNTTFYAKPNHLAKGWGKYCSSECQYIGQRTGKYISCEICNKEIWKTPKQVEHSKSQKFFCSKSCQTVWRNRVFSGERHPFWVDGEHTYRKTMIESDVVRICTRCEEADTRVLLVHHIDKNRKNNALSNLAWLCHNCHFLIHHDTDEMKQFLKSINRLGLLPALTNSPR
jgi:hypothetical protein